MPDSTVATYDKEGFIAHFRKQAEEGKTRLDTWADCHDFHVLGDSAVCVLTGKHGGMSGEEMKLLCNIEWRFERWALASASRADLPLPAGRMKRLAVPYGNSPLSRSA